MRYSFAANLPPPDCMPTQPTQTPLCWLQGGILRPPSTDPSRTQTMSHSLGWPHTAGPASVSQPLPYLPLDGSAHTPANNFSNGSPSIGQNGFRQQGGDHGHQAYDHHLPPPPLTAPAGFTAMPATQAPNRGALGLQWVQEGRNEQWGGENWVCGVGSVRLWVG